MSASSLAASIPGVDSLAVKGKVVYAAHACDACHGDGGIGSAVAPRLIGVGARFTPARLAMMLRERTARMTAGGMRSVEVPDDEMKALVAYLDSLN